MVYYYVTVPEKFFEGDFMNIYFGENLKNLRREKNLTQEKLADFLGVSFQTISKWERGDTYPDITMLPEIAGFFKISIDDLLGVNRAENEKEITEKLKEYDNLTDFDLMQEIINDLKSKYPNDFRVLIRYLGCLVRFQNDLTAVQSEVISIYNNIQENCTNDRIRIKAKRAMIEFYRSQLAKGIENSTFEDCEKIICEMPDMRDSREMFCTFYPENHSERDLKIQNAIEESFLLRNTFFSHYFFYDKKFDDKWQIDFFKKEIDLMNFAYNDGNYGKMWRTVMYMYGHIGVRYFNINDTENALENFRKMAELAVKFDSMDRVTTMKSTMFNGKIFDKYTLGSTYIAKSQIKHLLTEKYPLSDEIKNSDEFKEIIKFLEK